MRTLQIINVRFYNATAWYAVCLAHILSTNGHPSLIVTEPNSALIPHAKKLGLTVVVLPLNSHKPHDILKCSKEIDRLCNEFKPTIVNCHRGESFFLWAIKKIKWGYKLIRTRGDRRLPSTDYINRFLHNTCSNGVIVTNTQMAKFFEEKMCTPKNKVYTILGGVNTSQFFPDKTKRQEAREELHFTKNDIVIGLIGRFDPVKGFKEAMQAFAQLFHNEEYCTHLLQENTKKLHLAIIGKPCEYKINELKIIAKQFAIPENYIHFIAEPQNIEKYMCMLDMGLIASISSEAIARVAFEMIACGVPLISSDVGVMPDIVTGEYMYEVGNLERLTTLFLRARDDDYREYARAISQMRLKGQAYLQENTEHLTLTKNMNTPQLQPLSEHALHANNFNVLQFQQDFDGWTLEDFYEKTIAVYNTCLKKKKSSLCF